MIVPSLFQTMPEDEALPEETASTRNESSAERGSALSHATRSLYRKYRPQSFQEHELVGQEAIVRTLRNAIRLDRVAHAYLFCGPRGTGKTTTARLLAKAVNCLDPDANQRPCNTCQSCLAITAGTATDIVEIDAASNRGIDDIRELRERVK
jgi:DNA polymerase-3 subunit gamma/tau